MSTGASTLPVGVRRIPLQSHPDTRGSVTEIFRADWDADVAPVQWNFVQSVPGSLRGVHVHHRHWDYLVVLQGEMRLGLCDLRPGSETFQLSAMPTIMGGAQCAWVIPPGIAHGFYFPQATTYCYGLSHYWDSEEVGCRWNDPGLGLDWPVEQPILSPRDQHSGSLTELMVRLDSAEKAW